MTVDILQGDALAERSRMTERDWLIRHAEQLRWEAANLRAMRLWLIEQQDLIAAATRIEAVAAALTNHETRSGGALAATPDPAARQASGYELGVR